MAIVWNVWVWLECIGVVIVGVVVSRYQRVYMRSTLYVGI